MGESVNVMRKWVFPILRLLVVAAIAVALVKLAFFADTAEALDPAQPTGQIVEPQVPVALGTITNDVTLPGTVSADAAVPVKAVAIGTVDELFFAPGQTVTAGDKLYDIKVETVLDPVETTDETGLVTITQPKPAITFEKVFAPASGVLSALTVIHGQSVAIGDVTGQVAPPSYSVSGSLSPEQQYRLVTQPTEASITITNGPAPFTCTGLRISTPLAGADADPTAGGADTGSGTAASGTTVSCAIPAEVTVFPGLAAQITIAGGKAENVLVVPTTAVKGSAETGVVWFVLEDGTTEERPVTLGMNDGTSVQVVEGLAEGDLINQFVPGAVAPTDCLNPGEICADTGTTLH
ncbi:efflux RND transporter periplasmic adaptor subunit [Cryobacterium sp. SO2]|uniref:efflux RND transporter periplasmic adaptor subunit n=1 Tax=Cryobacterium sp. SO2 TaxID=1897060 RepID=UPI00223DDCA9|nr:efflux RND transporter periplasmic adaptor subunit [Cryobacterium sp. SO2]WEO78633.1 efflux RND transporter periplasmic adaptor subunit [Cryobacterium sp. SO2]